MRWPGASHPIKPLFSRQSVLHVFHLFTGVEELLHQGEQLGLGESSLLQNLLERSKVVLYLDLHVLVHACAPLGFLAALQESLHLGEVGGSGVFIVILDRLGYSFGHLVADFNVPDLVVLEPLGRHIVLLKLLLHATDIDLVLVIQYIHLLHDTGEVSDLGNGVFLGLLQLLSQAVSELQESGKVGGIRSMRFGVSVDLTLLFNYK